MKLKRTITALALAGAATLATTASASANTAPVSYGDGYCQMEAPSSTGLTWEIQNSGSSRFEEVTGTVLLECPKVPYSHSVSLDLMWTPPGGGTPLLRATATYTDTPPKSSYEAFTVEATCSGDGAVATLPGQSAGCGSAEDWMAGTWQLYWWPSVYVSASSSYGGGGSLAAVTLNSAGTITSATKATVTSGAVKSGAVSAFHRAPVRP